MSTLQHAVKADHMFDETRTEPELVFYDNMVSQMDTELIDLYEKSDEEILGICKQVLQELPMEFAVEAQKLVSISLEGSVG